MFSKFFIYRPIFAAVISIVILIVGAVALVALPIARYPDIAPPTIEVTTTYPGANAVTVAETVATPLEQEVNGVEGMDFMTSTSTADGQMVLVITFEVGTDLDMANVLVQNKVNTAMSKLPEEARRQGVTIEKKSPEILVFISLYSPDGSLDAGYLSNYASIYIKDELKRVNGVGDVQVYGAGDFGMRIWLDPNLMKARGLTTLDVIAAVQEQNIEVAAGQIGRPPAPQDQTYQLTVNAENRFRTEEEFNQIIVKVGHDGELVYLRDVARIERGFQSYDIDAKLNGLPSANIGIYQLPGANALEVQANVLATLDRLQTAFPKGMVYVNAYDSTRVIRSSIAEVVETLFITLVLVVLTVYVFLQSFRATLIPVLTIPVSLIGTFAVMAVLGFSINQLTLFGLVLVIGIVVDDAIVVVENTTRLLDSGETDPKKAAAKSMLEVTGPVVATTLVLLAVFVPTIFIPGLTGRLFQQFAVTISIATVISSINALTLSPALCGVLLRPSKPPTRGPFKWFNRTLEKATVGLGATVGGVIRGAALAMIVFVALVVGALYGFGQLPGGFVPQEDEGYCIVNIQLPDAASMGRTVAVMDRVSEMLVGQDGQGGIEGIENVVALGGTSLLDNSRTSNVASFLVTFTPWEDRKTPELSQHALLQEMNARFSRIQEAVVMAFAPPSLPGVGMAGGFSLQVQDKGNVGLEMLQNMTQMLIVDGSGQSAISSMFSGFRANVPQLKVELDREQAQKMGVPLGDVFNTMSAFLGSAFTNYYSDENRLFQVLVQAEAKYRATPGDIRKLETRNADGQMVPLGTIVDVQEVLGPQVVTHFNIYPSAKINGGSAPGYSSGQSMAVISDMADQVLPLTMGFGWTDLSFQEAKAAGGTTVIFLFSIVMVYLVLAAQYESWTLPVSVCLAVPTALLGAVVALFLRGMDNNVYTQIGVVLLIGLSTKTAILIVEFAKAQRDGGLSPKEAAVTAAKIRFRAVLMTAFSFILGVIPLLIATGAGAESRKALGTCVFGGMVVATGVSVVSVPLLYFLVQVTSEKLAPPPEVFPRAAGVNPQAPPEAPGSPRKPSEVSPRATEGNNPTTET